MTEQIVERTIRLMMVAFFATVTSACKTETPAPPVVRAAAHLDKVPADQIVARVDGEPILVGALRRRIEQTKESKQQALDALIDFELLVAEARRRGFDRSPAVLEQERRSAGRLLAENFGKTFTKASIPDAMIERAYQLNRSHYVHPEMAEVAHVLARAGSGDGSDYHQVARELAQAIADYAKAKPLTLDEFRKLPEVFAVRAQAARVPLASEALTTPRRGLTARDFADACFAMTKPGQTSGVVKTKFGYHVIYLVRRSPARNDSLAQVAAEIRGRLFEQARRFEFLKMVDKLKTAHGVELVAAGAAEPTR
ncbi:MAG: peptidyl-prolyl cis-trans isomerase [Deltaproteobacteria bacterium]|nr:peptidyl-prolyl cis-trans isomerase [Deltaproteobacteria bacterium]